MKILEPKNVAKWTFAKMITLLLQKPSNTRLNNLRDVASDAQEIFAQVFKIKRKLAVNFFKAGFAYLEMSV